MSTGNYYVYITTNPGKTVLYTGVTTDIKRRISEHYDNKGETDHFASKYYCYKLIHLEYFLDINQAILREKEIKNMTRKKKEELISIKNPRWTSIIL